MKATMQEPAPLRDSLLTLSGDEDIVSEVIIKLQFELKG